MDLSRRSFLQTAAAGGAASLVSGCPSRAAALPNLVLKRGISIHSALNWPRMDAPGRYASDPFPQANSQLCTPVLEQLRACGFDFVRLTVNPGILLAAKGSRRTALFGMVASSIQRILDSKLNVVCDMHVVGQDPQHGRDFYAAGDAAADAALVELLTDLAKVLNHFPSSRVAFELWNEPNFSPARAVAWDRMQHDLYTAVRAVAPELTLVLTGINGWLDGLTQVTAANYRDDNLYFTFHYYDPTPFTHQGAVNAGDPENLMSLFAKVPYPITQDLAERSAEQARGVLAKRRGLSDAARKKAQDYVDSRVPYLVERGGPEHIAQAFSKVSRWAWVHGVPPARVLLGEFGVMRPGVDPAMRARWLRDVRTEAERSGFPWALWSYDGPRFMSLITDERSRRLDPLMLDALGLQKPQAIAYGAACA